MADSKDTRNFDPQTGKGMTSQEIVDRMAGSGDRAHPSAVAQPKGPGPSIHPSAKGVYGAPIQAPILK